MHLINRIRILKRKIDTQYYHITNSLRFKSNNVKIGERWSIIGRIYISNKGDISIGNDFNASSGINMNPIGGDVILRLICLENAKIFIGDNVQISNSTIFAQTKITVEDNVMIGGGCRIWDSDFHSIDFKIRGTKFDKAVNLPVLIEKDAFIGGGSIILKGVTIGQKSIVAAGSVVSKSIPPNQIWGGNPAKFIKNI